MLFQSFPNMFSSECSFFASRFATLSFAKRVSLFLSNSNTLFIPHTYSLSLSLSLSLSHTHTHEDSRNQNDTRRRANTCATHKHKIYFLRYTTLTLRENFQQEFCVSRQQTWNINKQIVGMGGGSSTVVSDTKGSCFQIKLVHFPVVNCWIEYTKEKEAMEMPYFWGLISAYSFTEWAWNFMMLHDCNFLVIITDLNIQWIYYCNFIYKSLILPKVML